MSADRQQFALPWLGRCGFYKLFGPGNRRQCRQIGIRGHGAEILPQIVWSDRGIHETIFQLDRNVVFVMNDDRMEDFRTNVDLQRRGKIGTAYFGLRQDQAGLVGRAPYLISSAMFRTPIMPALLFFDATNEPRP